EEAQVARAVEEGVRARYGAATRARDLLVVPALADDRIEGWIAPLTPAVMPAFERTRTPLSRRPPGCPELRGECVVDVPPGARHAPNPVRPGLHRPELGAHEV